MSRAIISAVRLTPKFYTRRASQSGAACGKDEQIGMKPLVLLLAGALTLSLAACGGTSTPPPDESPDDTNTPSFRIQYARLRQLRKLSQQFLRQLFQLLLQQLLRRQRLLL